MTVIQLDEAEVEALIQEFALEYLATAPGKKHLGSYALSRSAARTNWERVQSARTEGRDLTDLVLDGLLPHQTTPHNRGRGAWVHVAPAITRDLRKWFENAGWVKSGDWPEIANAVLAFMEEAIESPGRLEEACRRFGESTLSKGMQSAFLSPFLNAIRPEHYLILNTKSFKTLRFLTGQKLSRKIDDYPVANSALRGLLDRVSSQLVSVAPTNTLACDVLDQFCHWLIAIKKVKRGKVKRGSRRTVGEIDRHSPDSAEVVFDRLYPNEALRMRCLRMLADAVERAHKYGGARWSISLYKSRIRLTLGKLIAFELREDAIRLGLSLQGMDQETQEALVGDSIFSDGFATTPPTALYQFSASTFLDRKSELEKPFGAFLDVAAGTARRVTVTRSYSPGILEFLEASLGRSMPRPSHDRTGAGEAMGMLPAIAIETPRTVFKKVDYDLSGLLTYIDNGDIGLPDIQRPFVWSASKVRDLFDSMYRGFPIGYLLFWENDEIKGTKSIGIDHKKHDVPALLIVDGQQRLTSLYSVLRGKPVLDDNFRSIRIEIAFRPRDGKFEVSDAAIRLDPEFVPSISKLWMSGKSSYSIVSEFLKNLESKRSVTDQDKEAISHNLDRLFDLHKYPFTALEITPAVDEEAVADIFVRINSEGVQLKQADFILTLLSVFWDEGRTALEAFSRASRKVPQPGGPPSPFNYLIEPDPSQLLRAEVALGFHRARLRSVYQVLRGKDIQTGHFSAERRDSQFAKLKAAQESVLDITNWHQFIGAISAAGFRSKRMISSESALMYAYAFYLIGKLQCRSAEKELQRLIGRWFFMAALTGRYTGSAETAMESDLARVRDVREADAIREVLESIIETTLTNDFWAIKLPSDLERASSRTPAWLAYLAAQNKLNVPVLFSDKRVWEAMDPSVQAKKKAIEAHHLFPRAWLAKNGFRETKHFNQIANFAHVEWPDNIKIGATPPANYVPELRNHFSPVIWERMCRGHALPDGWEKLEYPAFLVARRKQMAAIIRKGFDSLAVSQAAPEVHEFQSTGTPSEQSVWGRIEHLERALREVVRDKYESKWGNGADQKIRAALGEQSWSNIQRNQEKYRKQYHPGDGDGRLEALEFCYLGQLGQLMTSNQAWELFQEPFRDKRHLEDKLRDIIPVRNDRAHFRSVPERELTRCNLAVDDMMRILKQLSEGT